MKFYLILLSVLLVFSVFVVGSQAIPSCTFRSTACSGSENCTFKVFQENDSHVGTCDSNYPISVCCTEITSATIRSSCNSDEGGIASMYATSNAHAGRKDYYSNIVCAKTANNPVVANIRGDTDCFSRETCAFTMFQQNNTHVGRCTYYSNRLCIQELFNVTITMILNNTSPNWNESVGLQGIATRSDGSSIDTSGSPNDVEVFLNSSRICATDTNSTGGYTCNFTAPPAIGLYQLNVTVNDTTTSKIWFNTTTFNVKQKFGEQTAVGTAQTVEGAAQTVACYEEPRVLQNPDGTIKIAVVRICVIK